MLRQLPYLRFDVMWGLIRVASSADEVHVVNKLQVEDVSYTRRCEKWISAYADDRPDEEEEQGYQNNLEDDKVHLAKDSKG